VRRERRNNEQPIHPPVLANEQNNMVKEEIDKGYINNPEQIHLL
jgi:hypothetical protein